MERPAASDSVLALRVKQWLNEWDDLPFNDELRQSRPKEHFYVFSMPASKLRSLAGIYRRSTEGTNPRATDYGIQRRHDPERSDEIRRYVKGGYPWSALSATKRNDPDSAKLRKPGWLPTAVVVNILQPGDRREGEEISFADVITIEDAQDGATATIKLPGSGTPSSVPPLEVIDGQHRLFAFEEDDGDADEYDLPVVAFHGLDISWQAYLFWTINIKPKKINPSLAFDLYPLLREQEWLEEGEALHVYKESRAQELTEILWSTPSSPWFRRINMLGGNRKENGPVTQAAFIKTLTMTMVKPWKSPRMVTGGLFGGSPTSDEGLSWSRLQQGAFLVGAWTLLAQAIAGSENDWLRAIRNSDAQLELNVKSQTLDPGFSGPYTLLSTDQGVRGYLQIANDMCFVKHRDLELAEWREPLDGGNVTPEAVEETLQSLTHEPVYTFLRELSTALASFDWRTSAFPGLSEEERQLRAAYRGSGGYKELRKQLVRHLQKSANPDIAKVAASLVI
ncbi:DGQHR domain-containing protein [Paenarthrobacter sp. NPDC018779]|uniref:DGQHR domain-containing protein n=1 Tax=Paenarthrobacter sp. NPDC018779 TaxID=3364375 RepID=UPI0037C58958